LRVFRHVTGRDGPHTTSGIADAMAVEGDLPPETTREACARLVRAGVLVGASGGGRPATTLLVEYSLWNLWFSLRLRRKGWAPIWSVRAPHRLTERPGPSAVGPRPAIADEVVAAARSAACLPWVHPQCTVVALAIHRLLARRGYAPELAVVAEVHPFNAHIWVELAGHVIDPPGAEGSLARFRPVLSERRPEGRL
jgi:hypothetical protein